MGKSLFIAEKPSVAQEFAKALKINGRKSDGFIESDNAIVTWCVGHLWSGIFDQGIDGTQISRGQAWPATFVSGI